MTAPVLRRDCWLQQHWRANMPKSSYSFRQPMGHQRPKVPQGSVHTQKTQANDQLHKGSFEIALQIPPPMKRTQGTKAVSAPTARKGKRRDIPRPNRFHKRSCPRGFPNAAVPAGRPLRSLARCPESKQTFQGRKSHLMVGHKPVALRPCDVQRPLQATQQLFTRPSADA